MTDAVTHDRSDDAKAAFKVRGLTKVYRTGEVEVHALRGVDLDLYEGEMAALLGPSGSGKSTFLNIVGGLDHPTAGTVRFRGHELTAYNDAQLTTYRRDHVGFVFQFYNLIPSLTARENVSLVTEIARDPMKPEDTLALVGLAERMDHFPAQLSGGEQQRVAIARALVTEPSLILADEPTGNLDSRTGLEILAIFQRMNRERGITVVLVTHEADIAEHASRIIQMRDGLVVEDIRISQPRWAVDELRRLGDGPHPAAIGAAVTNEEGDA